MRRSFHQLQAKLTHVRYLGQEIISLDEFSMNLLKTYNCAQERRQNPPQEMVTLDLGSKKGVQNEAPKNGTCVSKWLPRMTARRGT